MDNNPLLTLDNLQIKFPTPYGEFHAVRGVNLNIFKGQIYGVLGEYSGRKLPNRLSYVQEV